MFFPSTSILKIIRCTILIFRKYFRRSSLSAFYKIGVLKTSGKFLGKHICTCLFNKVADLLAWNFKLKIKAKIYAKTLRILFYRTPPGDCFWYLENLTFKLLILNKFAHSINIVGKLYVWWIEPEISGFPDYSWVIIRTTFSLKNLVKISVSTWIC